MGAKGGDPSGHTRESAKEGNARASVEEPAVPKNKYDKKPNIDDPDGDENIAEFISEENVIFDAQETLIEFDKFDTAISDDATTNLDRIDVLVTDLISGVLTVSTNTRPYIDMLASVLQLSSILSPPERFMDGHTAAVQPLIACVDYDMDPAYGVFLQQWQGIQENLNTNYLEKWRYMSYIQSPYVRQVRTEGIRVNPLKDVIIYNTKLQRKGRLLGKIQMGNEIVYAGDPIATTQFITRVPRNSEEPLPVFDSVEYVESLNHFSTGEDVTLRLNSFYTDKGGKQVFDANGVVTSNRPNELVVKLSMPLVKHGKVLDSVTAQRDGCFVFADATNAVSKKTLFAMPYAINVNSLTSLETVYPSSGDEVVVIELDDVRLESFTSMHEAVSVLNRRFDVAFDETVAIALRPYIQKNVEEMSSRYKDAKHAEWTVAKPDVTNVDFPTELKLTIARITESKYVAPHNITHVIDDDSESLEMLDDKDAILTSHDDDSGSLDVLDDKDAILKSHDDDSGSLEMLDDNDDSVSEVSGSGAQVTDTNEKTRLPVKSFRMPLNDDESVIVDMGYFGVIVQNGKAVTGRMFDTISHQTASVAEFDSLKKRRLRQVLDDVVKTRSYGWSKIADLPRLVELISEKPEDMCVGEWQQTRGFEYSTEYARAVKYNGDIDREDTGVLIEETDGGNFYAEENLDLGASTGSIDTEIAQFMTTLVGASDRNLARYVDIVKSVIVNFGERHMKTVISKQQNDPRTMRNNFETYEKPPNFWMSKDVFNSLMRMNDNNETRVQDELRKILFYYLPAVVKCLVQLHEITVSADAIKAQLAAVDGLFERTYVRNGADAKVTINKINETTKLLLRFDKMIKGMANGSTVFIKDLVQFPDSKYGLDKWVSYRPYTNIDVSKSLKSNLHKYIVYLHGLLRKKKLHRFTSTGKAMILNQVYDEPITSKLSYHDICVASDEGKVLTESVLRMGDAFHQDDELPIGRWPIKTRKAVTTKIPTIEPKTSATKERPMKMLPAHNVSDLDILREVIKHNEWAFPQDMRTFEDIEDKGLGGLLEESKLDSRTQSSLLDNNKEVLHISVLSVVSDKMNLIAKGLNIAAYNMIDFTTSLDNFSRDKCILVCTYLLLFQLVSCRSDTFTQHVLDAFNKITVSNMMDEESLDNTFERMRETYNTATYGALKELDREDAEVYTDLMAARLIDKYVPEERAMDVAEESVEMLPFARDDDEVNE